MSSKEPSQADPPPYYLPLEQQGINETLQTLIIANHILHQQSVLDAYGHVSVRHPSNPNNTFIMSADLAPALVSSFTHLVEYRISDASPVDPNSKKGYQERFIHSEIYKRFAEVKSVVHSHSEAVLPYTMSGVKMKPVFHIAGFLGTEVPIHDIVPTYSPLDLQTLLISHSTFGRSLAVSFSSKPLKSYHFPPSPCHTVVLMANHGFTTLGNSIKQAVYRAVYTNVNAKVQTNAITLRTAALLGGDEGVVRKSRYLDEKMCKDSSEMNKQSLERPWGLWMEEARGCGLYRREWEGGELES